MWFELEFSERAHAGAVGMGAVREVCAIAMVCMFDGCLREGL